MKVTFEVMHKLLFCNDNGELVYSTVRFLYNYDVCNLTSLYLALVLTLSIFYYSCSSFTSKCTFTSKVKTKN